MPIIVFCFVFVLFKKDSILHNSDPGVKCTVCVATDQPGNHQPEKRPAESSSGAAAMDHSSRQVVLTVRTAGDFRPRSGEPSRRTPAGCVCRLGRFLAAIPSRKVRSRTRFESIQAPAQVCGCLAARPRPQAPCTEAVTQAGRCTRPARYRLRRGAGGGAASANAAAAARGVRDRESPWTDPPRVDFANLCLAPQARAEPGLAVPPGSSPEFRRRSAGTALEDPG